jgi:hypothetical protein
MERGKLAAEQEETARAADLKARVDAARKEQADKAARLQDPAYIDQLVERAKAAGEQLTALQEAAKGKADPNDPLAVAEKRNARKAKAEFVRSQAYTDLQKELDDAAPVINKRKAEVAAAAQADLDAAQAQREQQLADPAYRQQVVDSMNAAKAGWAKSSEALQNTATLKATTNSTPYSRR